MVVGVGILTIHITQIPSSPFFLKQDCTKHPESCINDKLYLGMADHIVADGYLSAGYNQVSIDDCWEAHDGARKTMHTIRFPCDDVDFFSAREKGP